MGGDSVVAWLRVDSLAESVAMEEPSVGMVEEDDRDAR